MASQGWIRANQGADQSRSWPNGHFFIASTHPHRVWASVGPENTAAYHVVREVTVDGRVTVADSRMPPGAWPTLAVGGRLMTTDRGGDWMLWDPVERGAVRWWPQRTLGNLGAAYGDLIVSCRDTCTALRLTEAYDGPQRRIQAPHGWKFHIWGVAFSPDGATLAVPAELRRDGRVRLALLDVARRRVRLVAGSTAPDGYTNAVWSRFGGCLFLTGGERFDDRVVVAYRVGDPRARRLDVEIGAFYDAAAY